MELATKEHDAGREGRRVEGRSDVGFDGWWVMVMEMEEKARVRWTCV
jgi:hypothetical protein